MEIKFSFLFQADRQKCLSLQVFMSLKKTFQNRRRRRELYCRRARNRGRREGNEDNACLEKNVPYFDWHCVWYCSLSLTQGFIANYFEWGMRECGVGDETGAERTWQWEKRTESGGRRYWCWAPSRGGAWISWRTVSHLWISRNQKRKPETEHWQLSHKKYCLLRKTFGISPKDFPLS